MSKKPSQMVQVKVRMREDLRRKIEHAAQKNGLTINAEILRRLDQSFGIADSLAPLEQAIGALRSNVEALGSRVEALGPRVEASERLQRELAASREAWVLRHKDQT